MAHMAFWVIEDRKDALAVTFRQGDTVQNCGVTPRSDEDQLIGWMFMNPEGAQQYDRVDAPWFSGWVLETNLEQN